MNEEIKFINKKHSRIVGDNRSPMIVTFNKSGKVYFSKSIAEKAKLERGKYIHFLEGSWAFIANNNPDGFQLVSDGGKKQGFVINNIAVVREFLKDRNLTFKDLPLSYYVQSGGKEINKNPLMEIMLNKTVKQLKTQ